MIFRRIRGLSLSYREQGLIRFLCLCYDRLPQWGMEEMQEKIYIHSQEQGGDYWQALFQTMTTAKPVETVAQEYGMSDRTLYRLRIKFYERWKWR